MNYFHRIQVDRITQSNFVCVTNKIIKSIDLNHIIKMYKNGCCSIYRIVTGDCGKREVLKQNLYSIILNQTEILTDLCFEGLKKVSQKLGILNISHKS